MVPSPLVEVVAHNGEVARRWVVAIVAAAIAATGIGVGVHLLTGGAAPPPPACWVGKGPARLTLAPDQAADATTIAAVAGRMRLPDHAVTVALATALQESKLHNYPFGDRDSLGLFQQRPSQGWGDPGQLLTPSYAARAFYRHLQTVPGWERIPVAKAAQSVQHSAFGDAYGQWEEAARALARVLTGEVTPGLSCAFAEPRTGKAVALRALADQELGPGALGPGGGRGHDWTVAQWIVGHAYAYGVVEVTVHGYRWTPASGRWTRVAGSGGGPRFRLAPPARA